MQVFDEFVKTIAALRGENGCPWDIKQTHESLKECLLEETGEVIDAIDHKDDENLCEELGDLLMLIVLESRIAEEEGLFTLDDVITGISAKMKYRHPKIFSPEDQEAAQLSWDELKKREKELRISSGNKPSDLV